MFTELSPLFIPLAAFLGCALSPVIGWALNYRDALKAGTTPESFNFKQLSASVVIAFLAGFYELSQYSAAASVGAPDLVNAFVAGFSFDAILKNLIGVK